jgi:predicted CopG family antitoxin
MANFFMKIDFDTSNRLVTLTKSGEASVSDMIEFIDKGVALGLKHNCYDLLFNMQKEKGSFLELYELHKNLIEITDLTFGHRFAVVFSPSENKSGKQFYETISIDW